MVRAAATGVVDFREARLFDRDWMRRLNWLLNEVETKDCQKLMELKFLQHASALSYESGKEAFDHHWKQLNGMYSKWLGIVMPWMKDETGEHSNEKLFDAWKQVCGDPADPEVADRIDQAVKQLNARMPGPNIGLFGGGSEACTQDLASVPRPMLAPSRP